MEQEEKTFEYYAFISYSHKDQNLAKRLQKRLQNQHLPSALQKIYPELPKSLKPIFLDESNLVGIGTLKDSLEENLDKSKHLIVLCSPNSARSVYVNREVEHFIANERLKQIIPLIVDGVPHSDDASVECFPPALRNLSIDDELLGIDLTKFNQEDVFIRIIARMLGLDMALYKYWEERERRRRCIRNSCIAAVFVIIIGGLALYNFYLSSDVQNAAAYYKRGDQYYYGNGVEQDYVRAAELYLKAATYGNDFAQIKIGLCYEFGYGVEKDYVKAMEWYQKAAEHNNALAQAHIGFMYLNGLGVEQDNYKAFEWLKKAADQGVVTAQGTIGLLYEYGDGVEKDHAKAVEWYEKAAEKGNSTAQNHLGFCTKMVV